MRLVTSAALSPQRAWRRLRRRARIARPQPARDPALRIAVYLVTGLFAAAGAHNVRRHRPPPPPPATVAPAPSLPALRALRDSRPLDLNRAAANDLQLLPGIGPRLSGRIVAHRRAHGSFSSVGQLRAVQGIGPKTLARLRPHLTVKASRRAPPARPP